MFILCNIKFAHIVAMRQLFKMSEITNNQQNDILDSIIKASVNTDFYVAEDIYDQSNNKLLAKGYKITPEIKDKLFDRVLKKPIETSIQSDHSITSKAIVEAALALIKQNALLKVISSDIEAEANSLIQLELHPLAIMLLTIMRDSETNQFNHALLVTLIARSIARNMNISNRDCINLSLSSLLHDVGELYLPTPENGEFTKESWRKVMAHPVIGSSLIKLYMNYDSEVSTAILEHHERCDGTGYPRKLDANHCSMNGQILMLSEAIAGIFNAGVETQNILVAFKLTSHVYPELPLNAFNQMLKSLQFVRSENDKNVTINHLTVKMKTLNEVLLKLDDILNTNDLLTPIKESANHLQFRIKKLKQAIYSSGIQYYLEDNSWLNSDDNQLIGLELEISTNEVGWQIQDMIRDVSLRMLEYNSELPELFTEIMEQLGSVNQERLTA